MVGIDRFENKITASRCRFVKLFSILFSFAYKTWISTLCNSPRCSLSRALFDQNYDFSRGYLLLRKLSRVKIFKVIGGEALKYPSLKIQPLSPPSLSFHFHKHRINQLDSYNLVYWHATEHFTSTENTTKSTTNLIIGYIVTRLYSNTRRRKEAKNARGVSRLFDGNPNPWW